LLHELRSAAEPVQRAYLALSMLKTGYHNFCMVEDDGGPSFLWQWSKEMEDDITSKTRNALARCQEAVDALGESLAVTPQKGAFARIFRR